MARKSVAIRRTPESDAKVHKDNARIGGTVTPGPSFLKTASATIGSYAVFETLQEVAPFVWDQIVQTLAKNGISVDDEVEAGNTNIVDHVLAQAAKLGVSSESLGLSGDLKQTYDQVRSASAAKPVKTVQAVQSNHLVQIARVGSRLGLGSTTRARELLELKEALATISPQVVAEFENHEAIFGRIRT